ncbi:MAG: hypothetical protein U9N73_00845 [Candidatus Auribacterota bacterium]|nr:hypothetical protein [Candidatus Auribacterota bacterium]
MKNQPVKYYLDQQNRFVIENYNRAKPFSNFFPGIAGKWGIPTWIYYVNRAQGICSAGVKDKDHQIMEFLSFNRACQVIPRQGFRTMIRLKDGKFFEPFQKTDSPAVEQKMLVSSGELELRESRRRPALEVNLLYYPLVQYPLPAFIREITFKNRGKSTLKFDLLDGLPRILPYGMEESHVKSTARHIEGMMGVGEIAGAPIFRLKQTAADREEISYISGGNFYFSLAGDQLNPGQYIVDPACIFEEPFNYDTPRRFKEDGLSGVLSQKQIRECRTPCAFTGMKISLKPGEEFNLTSLIGACLEDRDLVTLTEDVRKKGFLSGRKDDNREILDRIKNYTLTVSSSRIFNQYCGQDFLDNVIRGGMPLVFEDANKKSVFYLYSRQNGDLERDYHHFVIEPTYLSQGNGHYRSVHQNRRMDTWFFPEIEDANLHTFMDLIQLDGYNPLEVKGFFFSVTDRDGLKKWLKNLVGKTDIKSIMQLVESPFTPGAFLRRLEKAVDLPRDRFHEVVSRLSAFCRQDEAGGIHEGFWIDHWTYNLDLIDSYLMIYPDRRKDLLIGKRDYSFFDDPDVVLPRKEKHVKVGNKIRCYGAVVRDREKQEMIDSRPDRPFQVRTRHGKGKIYTTTLMVKLLCVAANRLATLDPLGRGMEMEADKPGWNDSMNGLPGILGSSLGEALELRRLLRFLLKSLKTLNRKGGLKVSIYQELARFIDELNGAVKKRLDSKARSRRFIFWDDSHTLLEEYREKTRLGVGGKNMEVSADKLIDFIKDALNLMGLNLSGRESKKLFSPGGVPYTYFINEVDRYRPIWKDREKKIPALSHGGYPLVEARSFKQRPTALFLEGPVHYLRTNPKKKKEIYRAVKNSRIYDQKLKMYKSCESLKDETFEIGRVKAYPPGWIENESVYLHMEYKYLLELLRSGLYSEFYRDIETAMVCFCDPAVYGRSILEGASFIASSAFPDASLHGQAFQPRLSGITCEMLHIWTLMVAGPHPFLLNRDGNACLALEPALAGRLFTRTELRFDYYDDQDGWESVTIPPDSFAFRFIGRVLVVYHNPGRKNTFGPGGVSPRSYRLDYGGGKTELGRDAKLSPPGSWAVREGRVKRIDVILG